MRNRQHQAINTLGLDRDALLEELKQAFNNTTVAREAIAEALKAGRTSKGDADRDMAIQSTRRSELRTLINDVLNKEFLAAWHAAYNASKDGVTPATKVTSLYTTAEEIYERVYTAFHGTPAPTKKTAPKADDKVEEKKTDAPEPKPAPAPKADKDDDEEKAKKDDSKPAEKTAPKADDKDGKDEPVTGLDKIAAMLDRNQAECRDGFAKLEKGVLTEDRAQLINGTDIEKLRALLDGTATTAGLSTEDRKLLDELQANGHGLHLTEADRKLLDLLLYALNPYTGPEVIDMFDALGGGNKFLGGLLRGIGRTGRPDTNN